MSKAPDPPDPYKTAEAQTGTNVSTAIANSILGNVDQYGPDGSITYDQTGQFDWTDPTSGTTYTLPKMTATQTLSETQQAIKDRSDAANLNLATIADDQSAFLGDYLGMPVDTSAEAVDAYTNTHFDDDFTTQWTRNEDDLRNRLAAQGVRLGSTAFDRAMEGFNTSKANAWDNLKGNQFDRARAAIFADRNQPINEITALLSGSQVETPTPVPVNEATLPTTDIAGLINKNYDQRLGQWQQNQAIMGGLFSLPGKFAGFF